MKSFCIKRKRLQCTVNRNKQNKVNIWCDDTLLCFYKIVVPGTMSFWGTELVCFTEHLGDSSSCDFITLACKTPETSFFSALVSGRLCNLLLSLPTNIKMLEKFGNQKCFCIQ